VRRKRIKIVHGRRAMVEEMVSGRPPWKKNSMWLSMHALFYWDISALIAWFLVGEERSIDVELSGMRIDFAAMRVKESEGVLYSAVHVGAE